MTWVRLDDKFHEHPKALAAGLQGRALFIAGLCWCSSQLTDGRIPRGALGLIAAMAEVPARAAARKCVEAGLWEETPDGWQVHDYLDFQQPATDMRAKRSDLSAKRADAGRRGAASRWADGNRHGKQHGNADGKRITTARQADGPTPTPIESASHSLERAMANATTEPTTDTERRRFAEAVAELVKIGATPDDVQARAHAYRRQWPDMRLTPGALVKHWSSLNGSSRPTEARPVLALDRDRSCPACSGSGWIEDDTGTARPCPHPKGATA